MFIRVLTLTGAMTCSVIFAGSVFAKNMTETALNSEELAAWEQGQTEGFHVDSLYNLAYCATIWEYWRHDLEESGNSTLMPEELDFESADMHSLGYDKVYEMTALQLHPEWKDQAELLGPLVEASAEVEETKEYREDYIYSLSSCFRDDLFQKSREE